MIKIELVIKGAKGNVIIKGSSLDEVLTEYEANRRKIEGVLGEVSVTVSPLTQVRPTLPASTLQGRITSLNRDGFFAKARTATEVKNKLKEKGYTYSIDRVRMALIRLVRKKQLRRLMERREEKQVYVYVNP